MNNMLRKDKTLMAGFAHTLDPRQWVGNHADYLYNYAITRINDTELARDLVQETFLAALERLEGFEGRSAERTWLTAILKHKIIDAYRKRTNALVDGHDETIYASDGAPFFESADGHWKERHLPQEFARTADAPLLSKEFQGALLRCMAKLPAVWLTVFTMKHIDEISTDVICHDLNVTAANFWVIIHRAKVNLRACLQKTWT